MIRFIDLRDQGTQCRFAWWNTTSDRFMEFDGEMAWNTFNEFAEAFLCVRPHRNDISRFKNLCPPWVHLEPTTQEEDAWWGFVTSWNNSEVYNV